MYLRDLVNMNKPDFLNYYSHCLDIGVSVCDDAEFQVSGNNVIGISLEGVQDKEVLLPSFVDVVYHGSVYIEFLDLNNVTSIEEDGFFKNIKLKRVVGNALFSCVDGAFSDCAKLESVSFPNLAFIGDFAFSNCPRLKDVNLPSLLLISDFAFTHTSLKEFRGENVESIGLCAFKSTKLQLLDAPSCKELKDTTMEHRGELLIRVAKGCKIYSSYTKFKSISEYISYSKLHPEAKPSEILRNISVHQYLRTGQQDKYEFQSEPGYYTDYDDYIELRYYTIVDNLS